MKIARRQEMTKMDKNEEIHRRYIRYEIFSTVAHINTAVIRAVNAVSGVTVDVQSRDPQNP